MKTTTSPAATGTEDATIACPVCGRPARATFIRSWIAHILCRRCRDVWQIPPTRH
jgi:hypothetical protein